MPESKGDLRPIQVFLDTKRFIELEAAEPLWSGPHLNRT